jgi:hypothetical protein
VIVILESKPYCEMRYNTLGDWYLDETGALRVVVAKDDGVNPIGVDEQKLILLHELVEVWLCEKKGITQKQVDEFDFAFEKRCEEGEPGDHPDAPYRVQHRAAMLIEHMMAHFMGLDGYGKVE